MIRASRIAKHDVDPRKRADVAVGRRARSGLRLCQGVKGMASIELTIVALCLITLAYFTIEFGMIIRVKLALLNVAYEGGSLASRSIESGQALADLLVRSAAPVPLDKNGRVYVSQILAGADSKNKLPRVGSQVFSGPLVYTSKVSKTGKNAKALGLTAAIYNHLRYRAQPIGGEAPDISNVVVIEVYYGYRPLTPLMRLLPGLPWKDVVGGQGLIIGSRGVVPVQ